VSCTAGIANPRQQEADAAAARRESQQKKAEVAAQARRAMQSSSSKGRAAASASSSATQRPHSAHPASSSSKALSATTGAAPLQLNSPSAAHRSTAATAAAARAHAPSTPFPLSTCSSAACRAELSLAYATLAAHKEAAQTQAMLVSDLRAEVSALRKQLHLYRLQGVPVDFQDTALAGLAVAAAAGAPDLQRSSSTSSQLYGTGTVALGATSDERRRQQQRDRVSMNGERELRREPSLRGGGGGEYDRDHDPPRPAPLWTTGGPAAASSGLAAPDNEPRFVSPSSPSAARVAMGRAFGGDRAERLDLSLSASGLPVRSPSARGAVSRSNSYNNRANGAADQHEHDDLVAELNSGGGGGSGPGAEFRRTGSLDRRPSGSSVSGGGSADLDHGSTQEFSVNYGEA
jgi:hypothetical protein